ncbi:MAG: hypothetical protein Q4D94_14775 [Bacillota bacterium]|nr:hypothetical protein [Bacillota bacterium]
MGWDEYAAKRKARRELQKKINKLKKEIRDLQEVIEDYGRCQMTINMNIDLWNNQHLAYSALELAPDIRVENVFEGQAAEELASSVPKAVNEIQLTANLMANVSGGITDQVSLIEEYIKELEEKIAELEVQLAALE